MSFPFCIAGTRAAARAQRITITACEKHAHVRELLGYSHTADLLRGHLISSTGGRGFEKL